MQNKAFREFYHKKILITFENISNIILKKRLTLTLLFFTSLLMAQKKQHDKIAIYQIFTRIFANTNTTNKFNGTLKENGTSKFNDINDKALKSIKELGISHVWYTGVIEHATMTASKEAGTKGDHPQVVKGIAGSPYAIKDYYDVNPYLATNPKKRIEEFEELVKRTHKTGLKVVIDFVPNHVAREYKSDKKPKGIADFGENDNNNVGFDAKNNFYYIPNSTLVLDAAINPPVAFKTPYFESPAKVTGNDVFSEKPTINDWFETIKLNYGVDYQNNRTKNFDPIPDTWLKMRDILTYWSKKGVDAFRCDMAEMVPVEFWGWVIPEIQKVNPDVKFIAEIYNPAEYHNYIKNGHFDYLYDKVGLYDALRRLIEGHGDANDITKVWQNESGDISNHMLRFLENHDEQRVTSKEFGKSAESAFAAYALSATLHTGPIMLYYGQELGVTPTQAEGFQGNDGRTTIFDFWSLPEMQNWIKGGFTDKNLNAKEKKIRKFYKDVLNFVSKDKVILEGEFHDLQYLNTGSGYNQQRNYSFLRFTKTKVYLLVFNFDKETEMNCTINLPESVMNPRMPKVAKWQLKSIENKNKAVTLENNLKIPVKLNSNSYQIWEIL
jgi:glycosidase